MRKVKGKNILVTARMKCKRGKQGCTDNSRDEKGAGKRVQEKEMERVTKCCTKVGK